MKSPLTLCLAMLLLAGLTVRGQEAAKTGAAADQPAATTEPAEPPPPPDPTKDIPPDKLKTIEVKNAAGAVVRRYIAYTDDSGREIKHGLYQEWYDNGVLSREVTFDHGMPDGNQRWWHTNGTLWMEFKTKRGVRDGTYQEFHRTGKLKSRWVYRDGRVISRN